LFYNIMLESPFEWRQKPRVVEPSILTFPTLLAGLLMNVSVVVNKEVLESQGLVTDIMALSFVVRQQGCYVPAARVFKIRLIESISIEVS
jgi:hypothetical protein